MHDTGEVALCLSKHFRDIHRHLVDLSSIILFDISEDPNVVVLDEVDCDTFPAEASGPTDAVDVQLA